MRLTFSFLTWLAAVVAILHLTGRNQAAPTIDTKTETPAEKSRRLLEQNISVEFVDQSLSAVLEDLTTRTKVRFVLDRFALLQMGDDGDFPVRTKQQEVKAKLVLRSILRPHGLTYVILDDTVLVTTDGMAAYRQMRQRVNLELEEIPLANALKHLARTTGTNVVLDPRLAKEAKSAPVSLQIEEVPLETAVKLVAEIANLSSVRVGNVLFVTTPQRAEKLRADPDNPIPPGGVLPEFQVVPGFAPNGAPGAAPAVLPMAVPAPPAPAPAAPDGTVPRR